MLTIVLMWGWIPFTLLLFMFMRPHRAIIASFLLAWLFLPQAAFPLPNLPDYTKMTATAFGSLLGVLIFDRQARWAAYRPHWVDLPMAVFCITPFFASVTNQIGPLFGIWDGLSVTLNALVFWGLPYLIGRIYLCRPEAIKDCAIGLFLSGLVLLPLVWLELRISPQLHNMLYGFHPAKFEFAKRGGGYRPVVFMSHGLALVLYLGICTICGLALYRSKSWTRVPRWLIGVGAALLLATTLACNSAGAAALMLFAIMMWLLYDFTGRRAFVIVALGLPVAYLALRTFGDWKGDEMIALAFMIAGEYRAGSLGVRLHAENLSLSKYYERPFFGWGGWGNWRARTPWGTFVTADSLWMITLGKQGFIGLAGLLGAFVVPLYTLFRRLPAQSPRLPGPGAAVGIGFGTLIFLYDTLFNAMLNPIIVAMLGALAGLALLLPQLQAANARKRLASAARSAPPGTNDQTEPTDQPDPPSPPGAAAPAA
ncbi:MAG: hypothetical protein AAGI68_14800 [Planctomycetota bacterium]